MDERKAYESQELKIAIAWRPTSTVGLETHIDLRSSSRAHGHTVDLAG